ncbi:unnamed protein product [Musa textilis]
MRTARYRSVSLFCFLIEQIVGFFVFLICDVASLLGRRRRGDFSGDIVEATSRATLLRRRRFFLFFFNMRRRQCLGDVAQEATSLFSFFLNMRYRVGDVAREGR